MAKATPATPLPQSLIAASKSVNLARAAFRDEAKRFCDSAPELSVKRFWEILTEYRLLVVEAIRNGKSPCETKWAATELMQRAWRGSQAGHAINTFKPDSLHEAAAFCRQYGNLADKIMAALDNGKMKLDRTDDPFGDLCDSLPLAGKSICDKILAEKYTLAAVLEVEVTKAANAVTEKIPGGIPGNRESLCQFILEGENYNQMSLREGLKSILAIAGAKAAGVKYEYDEDDDE